MTTTTGALRAAFLDYFRRQDHTVVASGPLVPANDPSLLFTNAGMVPFKGAFTGAATLAYARATSSQKCMRAGGKHNDLDNVGYTARHHTFFEMLGNFSFGDYFKEEAIALAWGFLTKELALSPERLVVTVYADDDEAHRLWQRIAGLPHERLRRIDGADNFWSMGDSGPCGPCSEVFYDHGADIAGGMPGSSEAEGDRFVEVWNLVFMQYETLADGDRVPLPRPSIDTGMGLERMAAVLQGVCDNYRIDLFQALMDATARALGREGASDMSDTPGLRVIADHLRACGFLIAEGVLPSNEGRGYVLRRIMRRAMRHGQQLGARAPFMHTLVPSLIDAMGESFPELGRAQDLISRTLHDEETRFSDTLARGLDVLDDEVAALNKGDRLSGAVAFKLYDTYGFPVDLTADILRGRGLGLDQAGFDQAMRAQKDRARASWKGGDADISAAAWLDLADDVGPSEFCGYTLGQVRGTVLAMLRDHKRVERARAGESVSLIVDRTPFYAQSGGQLGDTGTARNALGVQLDVLDTGKRPGDVIDHTVRVEAGTLCVGDEVTLAIDPARRASLCANHSATHLLHAALRHRLGSHVTQRGSLVAPDRLRFDISHPEALDRTTLFQIQTDVNEMIRRNSEVVTRIMPYEEAVSLGAMALFGETYADEVRVVFMGEADETSPSPKVGKADTGGGDLPVSRELCGGTHVAKTGDIGFFLIAGEEAVGSGVRRIEALTGVGAETYCWHRHQCLEAATGYLGVSPDELLSRVRSVDTERKTLETELARVRRKMAAAAGQDAVRDVAGIAFVGRFLEDAAPRDLKSIADEMQASLASGVIVLVARAGDKLSLVVAVSDDLKDRFSAIDLVRAGAQALGGKGGGGRPDMAQAGGPAHEDPDKAVAAVAAALKTMAAG